MKSYATAKEILIRIVLSEVSQIYSTFILLIVFIISITIIIVTRTRLACGRQGLVVLIIFAGQGGAGSPPPTVRTGASIPSSPKVVLKSSRTQVVIKWYDPKEITNCLT